MQSHKNGKYDLEPSGHLESASHEILSSTQIFSQGMHARRWRSREHDLEETEAIPMCYPQGLTPAIKIHGVHLILTPYPVALIAS